MKAALRRIWEGWSGLMDRPSRSAWFDAHSLRDVGDVTARWLEGDVRSQTGYQVGAGPDPETTGLIPALAAANRAGFVTTGSQPGCDGIGYDGEHWQQHAAVEGFADDATLARLQAAVEGTGLRLTFGKAPARRIDYSQSVDGMFGAVLSRRYIAAHYRECASDVVTELQEAWQVCAQDPGYGESTRLWEALDRFSGRAPAPRPSAVAATSPVPMDSPAPRLAARPTAAAVDTRAALETLRDGISALTRDAWSVADRLQAEGVGGATAAAAVACAEALAVALAATGAVRDRAGAAA